MHGLLEAINGGGGGGEKCRRLSSPEKQLSGAQSEGNKGGERYFCFLSPPPAFLYPRSGEEDYLPSSSFLLLRMVGWLPREEGRQREGRRVETKFVPLRPHDYAGGGRCIHGHWGEQTYINYVHIPPLRYSRRTTEYAHVCPRMLRRQGNLREKGLS